MDYSSIETLRDRHPAWRLLRASNTPLILSFLGDFFVEANRGACSASELAAALDDTIYGLNAGSDHEDERVRFPKAPRDYLEDWSAREAGFLRRFYPPGDDEVHYEITPAFEKAYSWVQSLQGRAFVGTESRLHTVVELLRQIVHGTEPDPAARIAQLRRRRDEIDAQIEAAEAGEVPLLDETGVRDRYQQLSSTARDLLSDFREVEDNFRALDRAAREHIAAWQGSKGELLTELVGSRSEISASDQGRSFQAFYEFLLSDARQQELTDLLSKVSELADLHVDRRVRTIHHDWSEAAERAQRTVRQISEQLRRFLDDQVWLENRRVLDLARAVESAALDVRADPPSLGLEVDIPGIEIALPFERPLYRQAATPEVVSAISEATEDVDTELLFAQTYIDSGRLAENIRSLVPERSQAMLADILAMYPIEQGAAEIVGYLALSEENVQVELDDSDEAVLDYLDPTDPQRMKHVRLPNVTVRRT